MVAFLWTIVHIAVGFDTQTGCVVGGYLQGGNSALLVACWRGQLAMAKWLIDEKGVDYRTEKNSVSVRCFRRGVAFLGTDRARCDYLWCCMA